jgi:endonuclease/exonuclease/phosphatase (EEP) superfamily protein YafD
MLDDVMPDFRVFRFRHAMVAAAIVLSLPLIAGFFGTLHPAFDSAGHFRVHLAVLLCAFSLPLLAGSRRSHGLLAMLLGIGSIATVSGPPGLGVVHASIQPRDPGAAVYRLLQMNLRFDNATPERVLSLIGRIAPDVVTLQEVSSMWDDRLSLLAAAYPHQVKCRGQSFGLAILSRRPLLESAGCSLNGTFARAKVDFGGRVVEVAALHLGWPWPFEQAAQVDGLAPELDELSETALLAGDLNSTPWSATARQVAEAGGLSRVGPIGPTWLYRKLPGFLRFAGLPIDQVFARGDLVVHAARALEPAGSDHLPVLVEFSLKAPVPDTGIATVWLARAARSIGS